MSLASAEAVKGGRCCWMLAVTPSDRVLRKVRDESTRKSPLRAKRIKQWLMTKIAAYGAKKSGQPSKGMHACNPSPLESAREDQ